MQINQHLVFVVQAAKGGSARKKKYSSKISTKGRARILPKRLRLYTKNISSACRSALGIAYACGVLSFGSPFEGIYTNLFAYTDETTLSTYVVQLSESLKKKTIPATSNALQLCWPSLFP